MKLPLALEKRPDDLIAAIAIALLLLAFIALLPESAVRTLLGLIFVLFIPGYVAVAALFPSNERIDWIERIALSLGLSIAIVPLIGLALNYTPWGIRLEPILASLTIFVVVVSIVAYWRRMQLPEDERMRLDIEININWKEMAFIDKALTIGIVIVLVATVSVIAYAVVNPPHGERFTQLALLDSNHMASDYPSGSNGTVEVCIGNNEGEQTNYTLIIVLVEDNNNYTSLFYLTSLPDIAQLNLGEGIAMNLSVPDNEWNNFTLSFEFDDIGEFKLRFLLYKEGEIDTPYREVYLWLTNEE